MTREEAIHRLKNTAWLGTNKDREETEQAVDMAIEALQAEAVSREAHYDAVANKITDMEERGFVSVVRCKDCKWYKKIVEKSKSGLCHYDIVARCLHDEDYCSHGERREP